MYESHLVQSYPIITTIQYSVMHLYITYSPVYIIITLYEDLHSPRTILVTFS